MTVGGKAFWGLIMALFAIWGAGKAWDWAGNTYFEWKCENEAGEYIYRTVENVEGVFQMRPRDPRDFLDRLRKGDIPEDPWGHTDWEAQRPQTLFVNPPWGKYSYFERTATAKEREVNSGKEFVRFSGYNQDLSEMKHEAVDSLISEYGYTWREVRTLLDRALGVWGGELSVRDISKDQELAVKRGFFSKHGRTCPIGKTGTQVYEFVVQVLVPSSRNQVERVQQ